MIRRAALICAALTALLVTTRPHRRPSFTCPAPPCPALLPSPPAPCRTSCRPPPPLDALTPSVGRPVPRAARQPAAPPLGPRRSDVPPSPPPSPLALPRGAAHASCRGAPPNGVAPTPKPVPSCHCSTRRTVGRRRTAPRDTEAQSARSRRPQPRYLQAPLLQRATDGSRHTRRPVV